MTTPEGRLVSYLREQAKRHHFSYRKCIWDGRRGAPDWFLMTPFGEHFWIELKAPGEKPRGSQLREHHRMKAGGCTVYVADSKEQIDEIFETYLYA